MRSLSASCAIYNIFIVNSLQMQAFFRSCGGKPQKWLIWLIWFNTSHEGSRILDEAGGGRGGGGTIFEEA